MSRTRLTALLVSAVVGATGLTAAAAPAAPVPVHLPRASLAAAAQALLDAPTSATAAAWRGSLLQAAEGEASAASSSSDGPREYARVADVGDLDGDGRAEVLVSRDSGTAVRSGKDGRVLVRRDRGSITPVRGAGAVRLLSVDAEFVEQDRGFAIDLRLEGLDRRGRSVWKHLSSGSLTYTGAGPLGVTRLQSLPLLMHPGMLDADGGPALLLAGISGSQAVMSATTLEPALLSLDDGVLQDLPGVRGTGRSLPWAVPQPTGQQPQGCYTTSAPLGPVTRVGLVCDAAPSWSVDVPLRGAYVEEAGDFDGDRASDVLVTTWGYERPQPREVARGTRVLSFADGATLGSGRLDSLTPLRADISGDGVPDLVEAAYDEVGVEVRGVTLAGEPVWTRRVDQVGSGWTEAYTGYDVSGDGLPDVLVIGTPDEGVSTTVVVDGRTGRALTRTGVNQLLEPGLRSRGADLAVLSVDRGRARTAVLSGDRGARLLDVTVPGGTGRVSPGAAGAADLDRDGRRDLVVASRTDDVRLTTAFSSTGRVLWQVREKAPPRRMETLILVAEKA